MDIIEQILSELEDLYNIITKTRDNFKKCPKARLTRGYVTVKLKTLDEYWKEYRSAHTLLLKNVNKDQRKLLPYFEKEHYYTCEEMVLQTKTDMQDILFANEPRPIPSTSTLSPGGMNTSDTQQTIAPAVKLPRIELPKFSGSYEEWPTFQDLFISLVHNNYTISNVQKLHYLKSSVAGEAELLLRHVQISETNYNQAWDTLKRRYSNKRLIVSSLIKRMFNQRKIISQNSNQIKLILDTTTECLNSLKNMQIKTENWDPLINFIVVQKLDSETHKEWEEFAGKEQADELPTFEKLKIFLESKFRTLELIQQPTSSKERTVRTHHISAAASEKTCPLCKEKHTLCHCKSFGKMEPEERINYVKSNYICYNCLVPGHGVKVCRLPTTCRLCNKRHHSLLHTTRTTGTIGQKEKNTIQPKVLHSNVEDDTPSLEEEIEVTVMTSQANTAHSTTVALLATALVECKSEQGHTTVLRALIDPGSQGCFISERAAQNLRARRFSVKGSIVGVGEVKTKINQAIHIEMKSRCEQFSMRLKAYVISKQLTTQLPARTIKSNNWKHLQGLTLADPNFNQCGNIDLLLGVNE